MKYEFELEIKDLFIRNQDYTIINHCFQQILFTPRVTFVRSIQKIQAVVEEMEEEKVVKMEEEMGEKEVTTNLMEVMAMEENDTF